MMAINQHIRKATKESSGGFRPGTAAACVFIVLAAMLAYSNSFQGQFIYDDQFAIVDNPNIRQLWPLSEVVRTIPDLPNAGRPLVSISLAINYAISGIEPWSYHAMNLAVHILAGLTLFGVVRRTLLCERLRGRFGRHATILAFCAAVLWVVHPLNTESVTYVIQRAESMVGLFYLLTLYCVIRSAGSDRNRQGLWRAGAILSCAAGMATKEVMVTAPLVILVYDRIFLATSFRDVLRKRWPAYAGMVAALGILAAIMAGSPRGSSAGFGMSDLSAWQYARSQFGVILHYLRLSFWPDPLVLDYGWPVAKDWTQIVPQAAVILLLAGATAWALWKHPAAGFLGWWFFVILAPTSSFVPVQDLCFEHRMYLPLAAVVTAMVLAAYLLVGWVLRMYWASAGGATRAGTIAAVTAMCIAAGALGYATFQRNDDYCDELAFWRDNISKRPAYDRPHWFLGGALLRRGRISEAAYEYRLTMAINPDIADPKNPAGSDNVGKQLLMVGAVEESIRCFEAALKARPDSAQYNTDLGVACLQKKDYPRAMACFRRATQADPNFPEAFSIWAWLLATSPDEKIRNAPEAVKLATRACELTSYRNPAMLETLAIAYGESGRYDEAVKILRNAMELCSADANRQLMPLLQQKLSQYEARQSVREKSLIFPAYR